MDAKVKDDMAAYIRRFCIDSFRLWPLISMEAEVMNAASRG